MLIRNLLLFLGFTFFVIGLQFSFASAQTYKIHKGDTINRVDENNRKQDYWIIFGSERTEDGYSNDQIVEEGKYLNNRKNGLWKSYFPNGKLKSEITYVNNRPNGEYKIYYDNGILEEQGTWNNNRNIKDFKRFYKNGQPQQDFAFNENGKREGNQKYFYENGTVMIEGNWSEGQEAGVLKEFYANGELKAEKYYNNGIIDQAKTVILEPKKPEEVKKEEKAIAKVGVEEVPVKYAPPVQKDETTNVERFSGNDYHTLYNKNMQISQKGKFKNGKLWDGERRRYDENGLLIGIEIYQNGKYVGEGVLPDEK